MAYIQGINVSHNDFEFTFCLFYATLVLPGVKRGEPFAVTIYDRRVLKALFALSVPVP